MARFITADHPVVVVRSRAEQTIPAGHLKIGDSVICGNGPQVLTEATPFLSDTDVFKITFEPDVVMQTAYRHGPSDNQSLLETFIPTTRVKMSFFTQTLCGGCPPEKNDRIAGDVYDLSRVSF